MFEKVVVCMFLVALANPALSYSIPTGKPNRPLQQVPQELLQILIPLQPVNETALQNGRPVGYSAGKCTCGVKGASRIVGGAAAKPNEWPWQALLLIDDEYMCGATLVSPNWVVTAAHCVKISKTISIFLGFYRNNMQSAKHITMAFDVIVHESYNAGEQVQIKLTIKIDNFVVVSKDNDIALVELTRPVTYSADIKPICLPFNYPNTDFQKKKATVTGWGATSEGGSPSTRLKEVTLTVLNKTQCTSSPYLYTSKLITDNMFCMYKQGSDSCQGDSGGPVNWQSTSSAPVFLIGVVSWGTGCARKNYPGVYTKVNNYLTWIDDNTKETLCMP